MSVVPPDLIQRRIFHVRLLPPKDRRIVAALGISVDVNTLFTAAFGVSQESLPSCILFEGRKCLFLD